VHHLSVLVLDMTAKTIIKISNFAEDVWRGIEILVPIVLRGSAFQRLSFKHNVFNSPAKY